MASSCICDIHIGIPNKQKLFLQFYYFDPTINLIKLVKMYY